MIPKIIVQTSICKPAQYIIDLFCKFAPDWKYEHYNDAEIIQFFNDNPLAEFPNIAAKFNSMEVGQHKADLFRYYFLYIKGGVFIDSDAMLNTQLDNITKDYDFFTVNCDSIPGVIFQGFIGGIPQCPLIYDALTHAYNITQEELTADYHAFCKHLYNRLYDENKNERPHDFPIKLYTEDTYNYGAAKTFDKLGNPDDVLLLHYYRFKLILRNPKTAKYLEEGVANKSLRSMLELPKNIGKNVPEYAAKPGVAGASSLRSLIELKNKENK
jgi:mannosyltransferase OCH1-like enzyme